LSIISTMQQEDRQSGRSQNILRSSTIGNGVRKDLDTYHLLFMNGNSMREGRQHEYYWSPLLTSEVISTQREDVYPATNTATGR
jgi:hypothetical protein